MSFNKEVWQKLSEIDVSDKIEKKQNLSYLSWAWAWGTLMEVYPESEYKFLESVEYQDGSMMVMVEVTIKDGDKQVSRNMWLPVLNYKNQAITHPDAMAVNTARMRCLTKCLAMFGLGHYIYAGEDIPNEKYDSVQPATLSKEQIEVISKLVKDTKTDMVGIKNHFKLKSEDIAEIPVTKYNAIKAGLDKKMEKQNENN